MLTTLRTIRSALLAATLVGALPALADSQNAITGVAFKNGGVEIAAKSPPNFTTFTMSDPSRLVVDVSNCVFKGVPQDIAVNQEPVTAIKNVAYGSGASSVARVLIGFSKDVETDIASSGSTLVVKVGGPQPIASAAPTPAAQPAPAAKPAPAPQPEAAAAPAPQPVAEAAPAPKPAPAAQPAPAPKPREQVAAAEPAPAPLAAADDSPPPTSDVASPSAPPPAEPVAAAAPAPRPQPAAPPPPQPVAAAEPAPPPPAQPVAAAEPAPAPPPPAQPAAEPPAPQPEPVAVAPEPAPARRPRPSAQLAQNDQPPPTDDNQPPPTEGSATSAPAPTAAPPAAEPAPSRAAPAPAAEEPPPTVQHTTAVQPDPAPTHVQSGAASMPAPPPEGSSVAVSSRQKRISLVGFRASDSQVFIRTNEPVNYTVSDAPDGSVLVTIENSRLVRSNDKRTLDAHFFPTPVSNIKARQVRKNVVVQIRLKNHAPYRAVQRGEEVEVNFAAGSVGSVDIYQPSQG